MEIITRLDGRLSRILAMVPSFEGGKPALIFRCEKKFLGTKKK
jgi:hypothetical protein